MKLIENRVRTNMVRNNIEIDVKVKCIEEGTTQAAVAEQIETTKSYVNRVIKKPNGVVNIPRS